MKKWWMAGMVAAAGLGLLLFYHRPLSLITTSRGISGARSKVILISFDGGSNELLHQFISSFPPDSGFRKIQKNGFLADQGLEVSSPSLTAPSHISIATGVAPSIHGIVSNQFHIPNDPIGRSVNGFTYDIAPSVETIWEEAKKEWKQVVGIAYPALDGLSPKRTADRGISYTKQESPGFIFEPSKFNDYPGKLPEKIKSYSPPRYTNFFLTEVGTDERYTDAFYDHPFHGPEKPEKKEEPGRSLAKRPIEMIAIDSTKDGKTNYDAFLFDDDHDLQNGFQGTVDLKRSPWIGIQFLNDDILKGSWCKLLSLSPDLTNVKLYVGAVHKTDAYPNYDNDFTNLIRKEIGFWPGTPDRGNLGKGVTPEMMVEQSLRLADYLHKATLLVGTQFKFRPWDLILTYQPMLDELEHQFLLTDRSQKDFSKEKSEEYLGYIRAGYVKANEIVESLIKETETENAHLIVVSDHGMAPLKKIYHPNRLLRERGYIRTDDDEMARKEIIARAFSSGGISHIYVNLEDREKDGMVPKEKKERGAKKPYEVIRDELIAIFKEEASKEDSPIQKVLKREEAEAIGLNHPHAGDVIVMGNPGFHFTDAMTPGPILETATFYGQHGYDPTLPVMKGIFAVYGPNFKKDLVKEPVSYKDIKPLVLKLLQ